MQVEGSNTMAAPRKHQVGTPAAKDDESRESLNDGTTETLSILDRFKKSVQKKVEDKFYELTVPNRPEMVMVFKVSGLEFDVYDKWVHRCTDKKTDKLQLMNLAVIVISNMNHSIKFEGETVDRDGELMTIADNELHKWLGVAVGGTRQAIKALYGSDGHAIQASRLVLEAAGYSIDGDVTEAGDDGPLEI
jgi:hypothetical protein